MRAERKAKREERGATSTSRKQPRIPRSVVVIDDHEELRAAVVEMLEHQGWDVWGFGGVEDALPFVRARLPDVVLTDINLGVFSGAALARELRMDPSTAKLTIFAMSGTTQPSPKTLSLFDAFLQKPVELASLTEDLMRAHEARGASAG